ncbi:MAG: hypothetical protein NTY11_02465 [Candidatus Parcubacteria bacterium]|nr:hypothetical protein [Candidatus Parcubacteria bacterium]
MAVTAGVCVYLSIDAYKRVASALQSGDVSGVISLGLFLIFFPAGAIFCTVATIKVVKSLRASKRRGNNTYFLMR